MSAPGDPAARAQEAHERRQYVLGFVLAVILTVPPFVLAWTGALGGWQTVLVIAVAALVQVVVHVRFFLHIDLDRQKREDLQLILFSALLLAMMAGGTLLVIANLAARMH